MIWIVRCPLRTYLNHPLTSSTLHTTPELAQGEKDFFWCLNLPRGNTSFLLDALRTFKLALKRGLAIYSRLHPLKARRTFQSSLYCLKAHEGVKGF